MKFSIILRVVLFSSFLIFPETWKFSRTLSTNLSVYFSIESDSNFQIITPAPSTLPINSIRLVKEAEATLLHFRLQSGESLRTLASRNQGNTTELP